MIKPLFIKSPIIPKDFVNKLSSTVLLFSWEYLLASSAGKCLSTSSAYNQRLMISRNHKSLIKPSQQSRIVKNVRNLDLSHMQRRNGHYVSYSGPQKSFKETSFIVNIDTQCISQGSTQSQTETEVSIQEGWVNPSRLYQRLKAISGAGKANQLINNANGVVYVSLLTEVIRYRIIDKNILIVFTA